jgi:putative PIN family toxin of toxin-antitoxin system
VRVVLDTNVFFSGFRLSNKPSGPPKIALELAVARQYTLVLSEEILLEIEEVMCRKLGWSASFAASTLTRLRALAEMVTPEFAITDCADPDDNRILEAAVEGRADCVTGDKQHLLPMGVLRGVAILTVSDFLQRLATEKLVAERLVAERPAAERLVAERPAARKPRRP